MSDEAISLANYIGSVVRDAAAEYIRRSQAGSSPSMNGALDYTELVVAQKALEWLAPKLEAAEARAAAAERERDELKAKFNIAANNWLGLR